jgi:malate synthase
MTINALNSGARVWLADLEDANTPHWRNVISGQVNLFDAVRRQISFTSPEGKNYQLADDARLATIVMRPRGWHPPERHLRLDSRPLVGALVDFGLYYFHNTSELLARGSEDKTREAKAGFDGSWVAHPDLVPLCDEVFSEQLGTRPNQLDRQRPDVSVTADDLLNVRATPGQVTEKGIRGNVEVALRYLEAWLQGNGAVGIHNLMEDAATAEISRSQIWQWLHNGVKLDDGRLVTTELVRQILDEEVAALRKDVGEQAWAASAFDDAHSLFAQVALADDFVDFLMLPAYDMING